MQPSKEVKKEEIVEPETNSAVVTEELSKELKSKKHIAIIGGSNMDDKTLRVLVNQGKVYAKNLDLGEGVPILCFEDICEYDKEIIKQSYGENTLVLVSTGGNKINVSAFNQLGIPTSMVQESLSKDFASRIGGKSRAERRAAKKKFKGKVKNLPLKGDK